MLAAVFVVQEKPEETNWTKFNAPKKNLLELVIYDRYFISKNFHPRFPV